jgi:adenine deaminase
MNPKEKLKMKIQASAKQIPADLVVKNGRIVNVFTGQIMDGDVAISEGTIVGIGTYEGTQTLDAKGNYIVPGFIDGHVHIESAMVPPAEFAKVVLPHGVTTVVADPHEIGNVCGTAGIEYMLQASYGLPLEVFIALPSCVPATPFENAGAVLPAEQLSSFFDHPLVLGLGEVMDFPSVANGAESMIDKLFLAHENQAHIDGHAAGVMREQLNTYLAAGIRTDHECVNAKEALDRLELGMYLMIREGSAAKDLKALLPAITSANSRRCLFVTDDKHLDDLIAHGSIDHNVRLAIENGIAPITAIQMATLNAAECFNLRHVGAIAPGFQADFLLVEDLEKVSICKVYKKGELVAENGQTDHRALVDSHSIEPPSTIANSINMKKVEPSYLAIQLKSNRCHVIEIIPNSLVTHHRIEEVDVVDGEFVSSSDKDQLKMAVIERHHGTGSIGLGIVKGFGLNKGAIATTIAHDSHNLLVVGTTDQDMLTAINHLADKKGGIAVVAEGEVLASLPLPIAGLMSEQPYEEVNRQLKALNEAALSIGAASTFNPFLTLSFLALPVIPQLKLTDLGLFEFHSFRHIVVEAKGIQD